jgi:hypothetical protein
MIGTGNRERAVHAACSATFEDLSPLLRGTPRCLRQGVGVLPILRRPPLDLPLIRCARGRNNFFVSPPFARRSQGGDRANFRGAPLERLVRYASLTHLACSS